MSNGNESAVTVKLHRSEEGVYVYRHYPNGRMGRLPQLYRATRRKWRAPSVCTSWDLVTPTGEKIECDTLREVRAFIADDISAC